MQNLGKPLGKIFGQFGKIFGLSVCQQMVPQSGEVGAHVSNDKKGKEEFIIPLCRKCNALTEKFDVDDDTFFASANRGETCGY